MLQDIVVTKIHIIWESASKSIHTHTHIFKVASYNEYFIIESFFHCFLFSQDHPKVEKSKNTKQNKKISSWLTSHIKDVCLIR